MKFLQHIENSINWTRILIIDRSIFEGENICLNNSFFALLIFYFIKGWCFKPFIFQLQQGQSGESDVARVHQRVQSGAQPPQSVAEETRRGEWGHRRYGWSAEGRQRRMRADSRKNCTFTALCFLMVKPLVLAHLQPCRGVVHRFNCADPDWYFGNWARSFVPFAHSFVFFDSISISFLRA